MHTFKKGIHPPYNKDITKDSAIKVMPVKDVTIPLLQHIGKVCEPVVKEGDYVKAAQLIGTSDKGMYSNIYSSVSGFVKGIKDIATVNG